MTTADDWLAELPPTEHPDDHDPSQCPWHRFEQTDHDSWGYKLGSSLVIRSHEVTKQVLGDRRYKQGLLARLLEKSPNLDPRFLKRRQSALLAREGDDHLRMRRIASKSAFTPRAADRHRPLMRATMHELADQIPADGVYDAVALMHDYPSRVIAQVLGSRPDEVTSFSSLTETIFDAQRGDPDSVARVLEAMEALDDRIAELIDRKRADPSADLISDLIRAETEDGTLSQKDVQDISVAVVMAGTETTRNMLTRGLVLLAERPAIWAELDDDQKMGAAVEEILRFAPLSPVRRVASEETDIEGVTVPEGALIIVDFGAANRDPAAVEDPHIFRIDRAEQPRHFTLSHGHKFCLGANLARAEIFEALSVLRQRFSTLDVVEPPEWVQAGGIPRGSRIMLRFGR